MKRFSIFLIILFSAFLGFSRVSAMTADEANDENYLYELVDTIKQNNSDVDWNTYNKYFIHTYYQAYNNMYNYYVVFYSNDSDINLYVPEYDLNAINISCDNCYVKNNGYDFKFHSASAYNYKNSNHEPIQYLLTNDLYLNNEIYLKKNVNVSNEEYTINFHLNGGTVTIPDIEICDNIGCYIKDEIHYEDYSIKLSAKDFENYIKSLKIEKQNMRFQGFFYDKQLTNEISNNFIIDSDKDIYAKWDYADVNDFLKNNTFKSYTFDTNYSYAVISIGKNYGQDIYLGLDFLTHNLEIYKYKKDESNQDIGSYICITSNFSKNNKYYYKIKTNDIDNYNVFILPRTKLETLQNGEVINYYNFLLTDNAHVTYTNDLKQIEIYNDEDNKIIIDLEDRYNYAQDTLISDESNLLEIFKDLLRNMNNDIFSYFNQIWNHLKSNKLYTYFMLLIAGGIVILIIKAANRK